MDMFSWLYMRAHCIQSIRSSLLNKLLF